MISDEKRIENPEARREAEERRKAKAFYDEEPDFQYVMLYPNDLAGGVASATGSTGLIQIIPATSEELASYEEVNSFRQRAPIINDEDI